MHTPKLEHLQKLTYRTMGHFELKRGGWENSFLLYIMLQISVATLEKSANLFSLMHKYMFYNIKKRPTVASYLVVLL